MLNSQSSGKDLPSFTAVAFLLLPATLQCSRASHKILHSFETGIVQLREGAIVYVTRYMYLMSALALGKRKPS